MMLIIRPFLDPVCHMIHVINVHIKWWDPHAFSCSCLITLDIVFSVSYYVELQYAITIIVCLILCQQLKVTLVVLGGGHFIGNLNDVHGQGSH